jgi:hypothetical protein
MLEVFEQNEDMMAELWSLILTQARCSLYVRKTDSASSATAHNDYRRTDMDSR